jgi:hypothetical protein
MSDKKSVEKKIARELKKVDAVKPKGGLARILRETQWKGNAKGGKK